MNRYSQITTSEFNPLSFQEIMAAPLAMRQKHDSLDAQRELLRQGLAKTNPHEKYYEEAVKLKDELNNQINTQAELLAKEGVNPNSQSEFLKLNRNYQETMSPTGKLGMINAHNVNLQSTYKNYIDEAIKAGQSPAIAKLHADQAIQKHMKEPLYDERGRVVDFSAGNAAPKYIDNVKWINELASKVGFTQSNWAQASSGISKTADGRFVVNESAKGMTKDNIENLNRLAQAANREVSDPSSEIRQNIDYNFKNPQTELDSMLNQLYARREREDGVTDRNKSYGSVDWNKIDDENSTGSKLIENNTLFSPNALTASPYLDNSKTLKDLQNRRSSLNSEERGKLAELETFQNKVNADLKNNSEYNFANKELNSFLNKFSQNTKTILKDPILRQSFQPMETSSKGIFNAKGQDGKPIKGSDGKLLQFTASQIKAIYDNREKPFKYENKINRITNKITEENGITEYGYQLVPQTSKDETSIKLATETLENALKSGPKSLLNYANIESVDIGGVSRTGLDVEDKEKIQEVFNNSERGSFKIVSFIPKTSKGKPGYIIEFNTKEGNSSNLNRYFRSESGSGEIGNGKPVRIKINYDQSKGKVLNTANGYIQEYLADKGDIDPRTGRKQGYDLAMDMRANADKSQINNEISKSNIKWGSMITPTTDFEKLNPFIQKQLQKELIKNYGLNNDTSDTELENMIKSFIKKEGSNNIYIE